MKSEKLHQNVNCREETWNLPHDLALETGPETPPWHPPVFFEIRIRTATLGNEESLMDFRA